jgi:Xaa-Pro aminopeptidase
MGSEELKEGMIISNEPGYYKENEYGIRIENLVYVKQSNGDKNNLKFETLTMSPIDKSLIKVNLLDPKERGWLNDYHKEVFKEISPFLDNSQKSWLEICCSPIH